MSNCIVDAVDAICAEKEEYLKVYVYPEEKLNVTWEK
jgi:hypothetical protein